jgi:hypothetical protein
VWIEFLSERMQTENGDENKEDETEIDEILKLQ